MNVFRVVLADDVADMRFLVRASLEDSGFFEVVGEAEDGEGAIELVKEHHPDLLVLDLSMPRMDGMAALPAVRDVSPGTKVVVLSSFSSRRMAQLVVERGAVGYIEKRLSQKGLVDRILEVAGLLEAVEYALAQAAAHFDADLRSAGQARRFLRETLDRWDCEELLDTLLLVVSELVTNAVLHAFSETDVSVQLLPDAVRVNVFDRGGGLPRAKEAERYDTSGRGLAILDAMEGDWGVDEVDGEGKVVWFEMPRLNRADAAAT